MDIEEIQTEAGEAESGGSEIASVELAPIGTSCPNCGAPLVGPYCAVCGQSSATLRVSLREIARNAVSDLWALDSRVVGTGVAMVWPPGEITRQYLEGKRARFVPAFRLYLICSLLFFLVLSFTGALRGGPAEPDPEVGAARAEVRTRLLAQAAEAEGLEREILLRVERIQALQEGEGIRALVAVALERHLPKAMFFLLPLFALLLRILYVRRAWVYAEHLVFALHYHALVFTLFAAALAAGRWIPVWLVFPLAVLYLPLAMRRVYRQGWDHTVAKAAVLGSVYFTICSMAIGALMFWAFWSV